MKQNNVVTAILFAGLVGVLGYCIYLHQTIQKVVVVDVIETVNKFQMKIDLEKKAANQLIPLKNKVDSLSGIMDYLSNKNQPISDDLNKEYNYWNQKAIETYQYTNNTINEQVWKRLNPLIDKFGSEKNYRVIVGANGMGTVLYNQKSIDITNELLAYINENYAKGEK